MLLSSSNAYDISNIPQEPTNVYELNVIINTSSIPYCAKLLDISIIARSATTKNTSDFQAILYFFYFSMLLISRI